MLVIKYVHVECEMLPFVPCTPTWPQKHRNTWTLGPGWSWRGVDMQDVAMMDTDLQIGNFCPLLHIKLFCGVIESISDLTWQNGWFHLRCSCDWWLSSPLF